MMWLLPLYVIVIGLVVYLTGATVYLLVLAAAYFIVPEPKRIESAKLNRFAIVVPAHNEELLISRLCESLLKINYPRELYEIFIVADNCNDGTAEICGSYNLNPVRNSNRCDTKPSGALNHAENILKDYPDAEQRGIISNGVNVLTRDDPSRIGKGFAISWALNQIALDKVDAVFMVDADNVVDPFILKELNQMINRGEQAIQCYNSVGNRSDSWFTQLLFVSRTIGNLLYHHAKYKLGLSSYLMGNGICFTSKLLQKKGWTAFTVGEDWEYYAQLIEVGVKIGFSKDAKVFHQESRSLNQATSQRLRWSSGRFKIFRTLGLKLFFKGLRNRDWFTLDASLPLIFPNYSLQINLTILTIILCLLLPASGFKDFLIALGLLLFFGLVLLFLVGIYLSGSHWEALKAMLCAPLFLIWKAVIDFLSFTRIYRREKWIRTERHLSSSKSDVN